MIRNQTVIVVLLYRRVDIHNIRPFFYLCIEMTELGRKRTGIAQNFHELTAKVVEDCGYLLYDDEYISHSSTLRVFIMDKRTNSAVIEDCVKVDRAFDPYCESLDWIPQDFVLEVSSPGVYRHLKTKEHFELVVGEYIQLVLMKPLEAFLEEVFSPKSVLKSKKVRAQLVSVADEKIEIELEDQKIGVNFDQIKKANLDPDLHG